MKKEGNAKYTLLPEVTAILKTESQNGRKRSTTTPNLKNL